VTPPLHLPAFEEIVRAAADLVRRDFPSGAAGTRKSDGTPVTATDRAVDAFLRAALTDLVPGSGWLSEESTDDLARLDRPAVWIVDPIDGTSQFVRRVPELAISVALVRDGRPAMAGVVNPVTREEGFWLDGFAPVFRGLEPRTHAETLEAVEAIVSRSETESGALAGFEGVVARMRPVGSVAYKLLRVASGRDALTFSVRSKHEWDVCAGIGLVRAAGLVYLRLDGRPVTFNQRRPEIPSGGVAGPERLAAALRDRLRDLRP